MKIKRHRPGALTRVEVCFIVLAVGLLLFLLLPNYSHDYTRSKRVACVNTLKQVNLSLLLYANDHGQQFPWTLPMSSTGTLEFANSPQVFRHFANLSNELVTPKILICPTDKSRTPAADFTKLANNNLSYFLALDADVNKPQQWLGGDRNITGGTLSNGFLRLLPTNAPAGWTTELHNNAGNLGLSDGSVIQATSRSLAYDLPFQSLPIIRLAIP